MFGSTFSLGIQLTDVTAQITGFLANPLVVGLVATGLALSFGPKILRAVKRAVGR